MTREEILAMKPGWEIDEAIESTVGHDEYWFDLAPPDRLPLSKDNDASLRLMAHGDWPCDWALVRWTNAWFIIHVGLVADYHVVVSECQTAAEAICKAYLIACSEVE
jgi:hypothetical protein